MTSTPPQDAITALDASLSDPDALEMVATLRGATALWLLIVRHRITAKELAQELGCTVANAYDVLTRLERSQRFVVTYERPFWRLTNPPPISKRL